MWPSCWCFAFYKKVIFPKVTYFIEDLLVYITSEPCIKWHYCFCHLTNSHICHIVITDCIMFIPNFMKIINWYDSLRIHTAWSSQLCLLYFLKKWKWVDNLCLHVCITMLQSCQVTRNLTLNKLSSMKIYIKTKSLDYFPNFAWKDRLMALSCLHIPLPNSQAKTDFYETWMITPIQAIPPLYFPVYYHQ
jgi:hypothetical protein